MEKLGRDLIIAAGNKESEDDKANCCAPIDANAAQLNLTARKQATVQSVAVRSGYVL